jgi:hypothetical protein
MKLKSKEEIHKLSKLEFRDYLLEYMEEQLRLSIGKQRDSNNYTLPAWPYMQAEELGIQKILLKLTKHIK